MLGRSQLDIKVAMICSSLNLLRFIPSNSFRRTPLKIGHISGAHVNWARTF